MYLCSYADNCVYEFTPNGERLAAYGRWGSGSTAGDLYWPRGMTVDAHDNVIVADTHNSRLQLLSPRGEWRLLAPTQRHRLHSPTDVALDGEGRIVVLEKSGALKMFIYSPY